MLSHVVEMRKPSSDETQEEGGTAVAGGEVRVEEDSDGSCTMVRVEGSSRLQ